MDITITLAPDQAAQLARDTAERNATERRLNPGWVDLTAAAYLQTFVTRWIDGKALAHQRDVTEARAARMARATPADIVEIDAILARTA